MMNMKKYFLSIIVVLTLIYTAWTTVIASSQDAANPGTDKLSVASTGGLKITAEVMKKGINLYQTLSEDKKAAIKEKMIKMSQERQKAIESVEKQIKEYKLGVKTKQPQKQSQEDRISRLQALQKFALKENAPETAKRFEKLIGLYENLYGNRS